MISAFDLPPNMRWLTLGDVNTFAVYAASGGLTATPIRYLIREGEGPMPQSLARGDLGLPEKGKLFSIVAHERGWRHAPVWNNCDVHSLQTLLQEINA